MTDDGIRWTENGTGRLAHVNGGPGYGLYVGHVSESHRRPGQWEWKFRLDGHWSGPKHHLVGSRQAGMKAIRRRWRALLRRGNLAYQGDT